MTDNSRIELLFQKRQELLPNPRSHPFCVTVGGIFAPGLFSSAQITPIGTKTRRRSGLHADIVPISAETGDNVDRLESVLVGHLPEGERRYPDDYLTDQPERFFATEIVREKVLQFTHAEIPFSSAVVMDRFEEPATPKGLLRLFCTIVVERESQKPIVVGKVT